MRLKNLVLGDMIFQYKYGFYFVYAVFTFLYVFVVLVIPVSWREFVGLMMIFSDPTAMGLMFIGSIIHLEIDEKTFYSIAVSPVTPVQYLVSKMISLAFISLVVALIVGGIAGVITNVLTFVLGVILGAMIFTALGMLVALHSKSLNRFMVMIVPFMVFLMIPGGMAIFGIDFTGFILHPGVAIVEMIADRELKWVALFVLLVWCTGASYVSYRTVKEAFRKERKLAV